MKEQTYGFFETVQSVHLCAGFQEGFGLRQTKSSRRTRHKDDLASQAEFRHTGLGAQAEVGLFGSRGDRSVGGDGDRHNGV